MALRDRIILHEGWKNYTYADEFSNHTWGAGHEDPHSPIGEYHTDAQIGAQLDADISATTGALERNLPWTVSLDPVRLGVFIELAFNMGVGKLLDFQHMLAAAQAGDWEQASAQLLDSAYHVQVGQRAVDLANIMLTGVDQ